MKNELRNEIREGVFKESTKAEEFVLCERDLLIFKEGVEMFRKKIAKIAKEERRIHLDGIGKWSELEDYIEHLQRRLDCVFDGKILITTNFSKNH